jgi:hypothetical protein
MTEQTVTIPLSPDERAELERLRARVAELEGERVEQAARANAAVAAAQERAYWLDRWHVDLNAAMRRPGAGALRAALRAVRAVIRAVRAPRRFLSGR